jgi:hypothetical protein
LGSRACTVALRTKAQSTLCKCKLPPSRPSQAQEKLPAEPGLDGPLTTANSGQPADQPHPRFRRRHRLPLPAGCRPLVQGPSTEHLVRAGRSTFRPPSSLVLILTGPATTPAGFPGTSLSFKQPVLTLNRPARGKTTASVDAIPTSASPQALLPLESSRPNLPNFCCL